jgi:hypothetical protein
MAARTMANAYCGGTHCAVGRRFLSKTVISQHKTCQMRFSCLIATSMPTHTWWVRTALLKKKKQNRQIGQLEDAVDVNLHAFSAKA